jgi:hypothetical protein
MLSLFETGMISEKVYGQLSYVVEIDRRRTLWLRSSDHPALPSQ